MNIYICIVSKRISQCHYKRTKFHICKCLLLYDSDLFLSNFSIIRPVLYHPENLTLRVKNKSGCTKENIDKS